MSTTYESISADNVIARHGLVVKGPDNKLGIFVAFHADASASTASASSPNPANAAPDLKAKAASVAAKAGKTPDKRRELVKGAPSVNRGAADWIATQDENIWKLTWKYHSLTYISMWEDEDGTCRVHRSVMPEYGPAIKDRPLSDRPLAECMKHIERWVAEGPQSWIRFNDRSIPTPKVDRRKTRNRAGADGRR